MMFLEALYRVVAPPQFCRLGKLPRSLRLAEHLRVDFGGKRRCLSSGVASKKTYTVSLKTGNRRGAGTTAQVFVQLIGHKSKTEKIDIDGIFNRSSTVERTIITPDLGRIRKVIVGHDNIGSVGVGWYLESVKLQYPSSKSAKLKTLLFPVRRWLGLSDAGTGMFPSSIALRARILDSMTDPDGANFSSTLLENGPLHIETGVAAFPHPDKVKNGELALVRVDCGQAGEDSYSIASVEHPDVEVLPEEAKNKITTKTICVADGVYAWREQNIDSGEYSRFLTRTVLHEAQHHVEDYDNNHSSPIGKTYDDLNLPVPTVPLRHPLEMLKAAEAKVQDSKLQGSSTICVVSLHGIDKKVYVANLGDSGCTVFRPGQGFVFRTPEQEHSFGYPFQLGHHEHSDNANDAMTFMKDIQNGDVILTASDGLYDNLSEIEMQSIIIKYIDEIKSRKNKKVGHLYSKCAIELASQAFLNSIGEKDTPWSCAAGEEFNLVWHGGKKDDICVVVAFVMR